MGKVEDMTWEQALELELMNYPDMDQLQQEIDQRVHPEWFKIIDPLDDPRLLKRVEELLDWERDLELMDDPAMSGDRKSTR
jgi:flagellar biosynthesis/type III secretory pathway protein FliH